MFVETKFFHKAGEGSGGGSDPHNLGYYADLTALQTARPTGTDGDFAILGSTDTIWVWDSGTSAWKDTDTKGQVTSVNGQTGDVVLDLLPSQTGQSGKFLTTDGTDASWSDKPLVNTATGANSLTLLGTATNKNNAVNIGNLSVASASSTVALGQKAQASDVGAVSIGTNTKASAEGALAIGSDTLATAAYAIQLGSVGTNSERGTFKVALRDGNTNQNYKLLDLNGTIPADRLTNAINKYSTMPTAAAANVGWIVQFTGTTDSTYTHGYIYECKAQGTDPETYAWESVTVQAGGGGGLPDQTGQSGKFLTTDGTDASWATMNALQNTATGTNSLTIGGTAATTQNTVNIGVSSSVKYGDNVVVGYMAGAQSGDVVIGYNAYTYTWTSSSIVIGCQANIRASSSVAIGYNAQIKVNATYGIAIGCKATVAQQYAIQLGGYNQTNNEAGTFCVGSYYNNTAVNYKMMDADGTIPAARHAALPAADGTYTLQLVIADGVPTLSWVAV